jgi:PKD repeat protein
MRATATRCLAALGAMAALLGAPAGASAGDEVRVEPEGGAARTVALSGLGEPDVQGREYGVGDGTRVAVTGFSLDRVLYEANVDPYDFAELQVAAGGGSVTLSREEMTRRGAFPDGPPVFWMEGTEARFLRPAGASGDVVLVAGGPMVIALAKPSRLDVTARASKRRVDPGERVSFTAKVSGAGAGEAVDVSWYFDDGRSASGARVTHRFRSPGTYDVVVGVTTSRDQTGTDATVTVTVGEPPDGPDRKGGGTNRDARAPDSGVGTGPDGAGRGGAGPGDSGRGGSGAERRSASEHRTGAARRSAAERRSSPERRSSRGRLSRGRGSAAERRSRTERRSADNRASASEPGATGRAAQVRGIELADLSALSSDAGRDALRAARRGRLPEEDDSDPGIPPAVLWTLGVAALLGLGGWLEARGGRRLTAG